PRSQTGRRPARAKRFRCRLGATPNRGGILISARHQPMTTVRSIQASTIVARPLEEVFEFFSEPMNLGRITPPELDFRLTSDDVRMRNGLHIDYRLRPILRLPARWRTLITEYEPPHRFRDVQLRGPYRRWEHTHTFTAVEGGTRIDDAV